MAVAVLLFWHRREVSECNGGVLGHHVMLACLVTKVDCTDADVN